MLGFGRGQPAQGRTVVGRIDDRREHVFREPRGLTVLLERARQARVPIGGTLVVNERVGAILVEAAVEWLPRTGTTIESFANVVRTTEGGTHADGIVAGLADALRDASAWADQPQKKRAATARRGLNAVVCVRLHEGEREAREQTRELVEPLRERAASNRAWPKTAGSGQSVIRVPVRAVGPTASMRLVANPFSNRCEQ